MKKILVSVFITVWVVAVFAQPNNPPENLDNAAFKSWVKQNWYNDLEDIVSGSDGYKFARLQMYNLIDNVDGEIFCFYSNYVQTVPSNLTTPGNLLPINCEHIVPQSIFGSTGKMRNDIHHLAPTFDNWNSSRGNLPFNECADENTTKWMRFDNDISCSSNCAPSTFIDEYSEMISNVAFEPKEDVKGNVARAVFYFFTMYPSYNIANVADVDVLYNWHLNDLPDAAEIQRNNEIENYQGNRNPYVDFTDWVAKAFIDTTIVSFDEYENVKFFINQSNNFNTLAFSLKNLNVENLSYQIFNANGKLMFNSNYYYTMNNLSIDIDVSFLPNGNYILKVNDNIQFTKTKKFAINR